MNAPRQGLYAALLATSFVIHAVLMVQGTEHQLSVTREAQGELMTRQLVVDTLSAVVANDTVGLALLTRRYSERPDVAQIRVLGAQGQVLASGGAALTRGGQVFQQQIELDQRPIGQVELTLIEPTRGEIIHHQWLPLLFSLLTHLMLWLLYRVVARPKRSIVTATVAAPVLPPSTVDKPTVHSEPPQSPPPVVDMPVELQIGFDDPRQLLDTLSPSLAEPYYLLCQTLLEQSITHLARLSGQSVPTCKVLSKFTVDGARIGLSGAPQAMLAEYAMELGSLFNLLAAVVYRRHREQKHFALHTRVAIAVTQPDQPAKETVERLLPYARSEGVVIHAPEKIVTALLHRTPLSPLEHPMNALMREAMHVDGLSAAQAQRIGQARDQILGGASGTRDIASQG
ncbi:MAG: hypothetical protein VXW65_04445 [Pseudomonadota bacterium]|nr:hypothetical protein [Pseudomonadota bacterium]